MKFVSSREIRVNPRPIFDYLEGGDEVVINAHGKPVALMLGVSEENLEETLRAVRSAKAQASVSSMRKIAQEKGLDQADRKVVEDEIEAGRRAGGEWRRAST
jgi:antitoxin (DNA-binding transcriptional repressor) of toxin-antitoxin stability system